MGRNPFHINVILESLREIYQYINSDEEDFTIRSLVCGYCIIFDNIIAVNLKQLRLLPKSKNAINPAFQKIGYVRVPPDLRAHFYLLNTIPFLKENPVERLHWSLRYKLIEIHPQPIEIHPFPPPIFEGILEERPIERPPLPIPVLRDKKM